MAELSWWVVFLYCILAIGAPRVAFALFVSYFTVGFWSEFFAGTLIFIAWESKTKSGFDYVINGLGALIHGTPIIITKVEKQTVEVPVEVEKIVVKTVTKTVRVRDMSLEEALSALLCKEGDDDQALEAGYKAIMKRVHPDIGGSVYLAAIVNQAKRMLIK
jgi:hypothetical protein